MFDLLVDIYEVPEETENAEPKEGPGTLLHADVPATKLRVSGNRRYLSAGAGVVIDTRMALEHRPGVTDRCEIRNVRFREGEPVEGEPDAYQIQFPQEGRRRHHLEVDLRALT